jgi:hypothetical protein
MWMIIIGLDWKNNFLEKKMFKIDMKKRYTYLQFQIRVLVILIIWGIAMFVGIPLLSRWLK